MAYIFHGNPNFWIITRTFLLTYLYMNPHVQRKLTQTGMRKSQGQVRLQWSNWMSKDYLWRKQRLRSQAKSEAHAKVCSCSLHIQRARLCERVSGSSLAAPVARPGGTGQSRLRVTVGLLLSLLPCGCWDKEVLLIHPDFLLLLLTEGLGPWAVAVWRQPLWAPQLPVGINWGLGAEETP